MFLFYVHFHIALIFSGGDHWWNIVDGRKKTKSEGELQVGVAPCRASLSNLIQEKRKECHNLADLREKCRAEDRSVTWRPRGHLVAHLTEHAQTVTGLATIPDTTLFASTSTDGTLRIWDCAKMEGRNIANKARQAGAYILPDNFFSIPNL